MSNEVARLAREWAQFELGNAGEFSDKGRIAAAEHILATTTPPTMMDVEWDWDKHMLAGATLEADGETLEAIMIEFDDGFISYVTPSGERGFAYAEALTPNGKKYELREVGAPEQPEHPATLVTEQDYENAPAGTVVAVPNGRAWTKGYVETWSRGEEEYSNRQMAVIKRQVLRWGWGKDEGTSEPTVSSNENVGPDQPEHPETLATEAGYENAPEGTIVDIDGTVAVRDFTGWYRTGEKYPYTSRGMRYLGDGKVIRRGWGK